METKRSILTILATKGPRSGAALGKILGISRQAVHKHVMPLMLESRVLRSGSTRNAVYSIPGKTVTDRTWNRSFQLKGLDEDRVFDSINLGLGLSRALSKNALDILRFSFTELLNNAVDHSRSDRCLISLTLNPAVCRFSVRDYGIGVFRSVKAKFGLADEEAAALEILKGKTTTWVERHSGQGIFFAARSGENAVFRSHGISLSFDNRKDDVSLSDLRPILRGTEASFTVLSDTRRSLQSVFHRYAPEEFDYKFERTNVRVGLYSRDLVSRSEARRLLFGLDRFREIIFDFKKVRSVGQAFADEIFRIFLNRYPRVKIKVSNAGPSARAMIMGAVDQKNMKRLTFN